MIALLIATVFSAAFGLVLRWAHGRKCNLWAVGLINYVVATAVNLLRAYASGALAVGTVTLVLGAASGVLYGINYGLFSTLVGRRGVSVSTALVRLAVLLPILASVLLWGERPAPTQSVGVLLALVSLPLLTMVPRAQAGPRDHGQALLALAMLVGSGVSMMTVDAHKQLAPAAAGSVFLTALFGTAGLIALAGWLRNGARVSRADIVPGVALGACNAIANVGLVAALQELSSVIVFPFYSAVGVVIASSFAAKVWGEQIRRREMTGMGVALAAVVLMNLGR